MIPTLLPVLFMCRWLFTRIHGVVFASLFEVPADDVLPPPPPPPTPLPATVPLLDVLVLMTVPYDPKRMSDPFLTVGAAVTE